MRLVIEYDREYCHDGTRKTDGCKTRELAAAAGFRVAWIHENDLPHLVMAALTRRQVSFRPAFGIVAETAGGLVEWAAAGE